MVSGNTEKTRHNAMYAAFAGVFYILRYINSIFIVIKFKTGRNTVVTKNNKEICNKYVECFN